MDVVSFFRESKFEPEDWASILPKMKDIHRGMAVELPEDVHNVVHDSDQYSPEHRAKTLVDHIHQQYGGLGTHWSDEKTAHKFAQGNHQPGRTKVVLHAHTPHPDHVETDPDRLTEGAVYRHDNWMAGEKEVPLKQGAPAQVHSVTWYGPRNKKTTAELHSWDQGQHTASAVDAVSFFREAADGESKRRKTPNYWADQLAGPLAEPGLHHLPNTLSMRKAMQGHLDAQGLHPEHPLRGVLDNSVGTHKLIHRGEDGEVDAGIDYTHTPSEKRVSIQDMRVNDRGGGTGTAMIGELARKHPRHEMSVYNAVDSARPFYAHTGADFVGHSSSGHWDHEAMDALRRGEPRHKDAPERDRPSMVVAAPEPEEKTAAMEDVISFFQREAVEDYKLQHRAPSDGDPLHDLGGGHSMFNSDVYERHEEYDSRNDPHTLRAMTQARGKPDHQVTVYRSVPHGVKEINKGDWVTLSPSNAHGEGAREPGGYSILKTKAPAKHLISDGNSLQEYAYHGPSVSDAQVHFKGRPRGRKTAAADDDARRERILKIRQQRDERSKAKPESGQDKLWRSLKPTPIPESERPKPVKHVPEPIDDRTYSVKEVSKAHTWEGFDPAEELGHVLKHPNGATFTHERVPIASLRYQGPKGKVKVPSYDEMAKDDPEEHERLQGIQQGYESGSLPPIVVARDGEHHILGDGAHWAAVHAANGETHVPAFVATRDRFDKTAYYHGTAVEGVDQILPAGQYAYATTDQEAARLHARTAAEASGKPPVVYLVEALGAVEQHGAEAWSQDGWRVVGDV